MIPSFSCSLTLESLADKSRTSRQYVCVYGGRGAAMYAHRHTHEPEHEGYDFVSISHMGVKGGVAEEVTQRVTHNHLEQILWNRQATT